jgi:hypothetical protein
VNIPDLKVLGGLTLLVMVAAVAGMIATFAR